jgi:hypothetical protein
LAASVAAGCKDRPPSPAPPPAPPSSAQPIPPLPAESPTKAADLSPSIAAPPGYPSVEQAFALVPRGVDDSGWRYPLQGDGLVPIKGGFALLVRGAEEDCHGCKGRLDIVYFDRTAHGWKARRRWTKVYEGGAWGGNFSLEPFRLAGAGPAIQLSSGFMQGGRSDSYVSIVELTPARPILRLDEAPAGYENSGAAETADQACAIESRMTPLQAGQGVAIHYTGSRSHHVKVDALVRYFGKGDRWKAHPRPFDLDCRE